jgi:hypothetical protein
MAQRFLKDPQAVLDYYIDWSDLLAGDDIVTSTWATPDTVVLGAQGVLGAYTQIWVSGGEPDAVAAITNHIVTTGGREDERTIYLVMRQQ